MEIELDPESIVPLVDELTDALETELFSLV